MKFVHCCLLAASVLLAGCGRKSGAGRRVFQGVEEKQPNFANAKRAGEELREERARLGQAGSRRTDRGKARRWDQNAAVALPNWRTRWRSAQS